MPPTDAPPVRHSWRKSVRKVFFRDHTRASTAHLDGVRALSFIWIFNLHLVSMLFLYAPLEEVRSFLYDNLGVSWVEFCMRGHFAMEVFFMMSSYLMTDVLLREFQQKGTFDILKQYFSRIFRLIPLYFAILSLFLLQPEPIPNKMNAWTNFLFVNNLVPFREQFFNHTWSIAIEVQFCWIFAPILLVLLRNNLFSPQFLIKSLLIATILRFFVVGHLVAMNSFTMPVPVNDFDWNSSLPLPMPTHKFYQHLYLPLTSRFVPHILGAILAAVTNSQRRAQQQLHLLRRAVDHCSNLQIVGLLLAIAIILIPPLTTISTDDYWPHLIPQWLFAAFLVLGRTIFGVCVTWIVHLCFLLNSEDEIPWVSSPPWLLRAINSGLTWKVWFPISSLSYSAYLLHVPLLGGLLLAFPKYPLSTPIIFGLFVASFPLVMVTAFVFHILIESPFLTMRRKALAYCFPPNADDRVSRFSSSGHLHHD